MKISIQALTPEQIEQVHEKTLALLWEQGVTMNCEQAKKTFLDHGARVEGAKIFIPSKMVEDALESAPSTFTLHARNPAKTREIGVGCPLAIATCAGVPVLLDETGAQRSVSFADYHDMLKLTQTSPAIDIACSGALYPTYKNPVDALYLQVHNTLSMTDMPLIGQSEGEKVSKETIDMIRRATGYQDKTCVVGICNSLSPMAWDQTMLEGLRVYAQQGQAVNISCCSMAGATAPIYLFGGIVEANAEVLAGLTYAQLVAPGTPVIYGTTSSVMDMGLMSLSLGTPEYSLISSACAQMAARYGLPYRSGGGLTDAKVVDAQAGMDSAMNLLISMNNGVSFMMQSVGILESYMSVSFEKWVMDEEIILRVRHLQRGLGEMPEELGMVISEGVQDGNFLGHETTLEHFRDELYWPMLADRRSFEAWKKAEGDYRKMARDKVKQRLASYECPHLAVEAQQALNQLTQELLGYAAPELPV